MRKVFRSRRFVFGALALLLFVAAFCVALLWGLPGLVRERAVAALRTRLDIEAEVGEVSVGWRSVTLRGFRARSRDGEAVRLQANKIVLRAGLFALSTKGAGAVRAVEIEGLRGKVGLQHPGLGDILRKLRSGPGRTAPGDGVIAERRLVAEDASLEVSDQDGTLAVLTGGRAQVGGDGIAAAFSRIRVGVDPEMTATLSAVAVRLVRSEGRFRLKRMSVRDIRIVLASVGSGPGLSPTQVAEEGGGDSGSDGSPDTTEGEAGEGEPDDEADLRPGTLGRLARALQAAHSPATGSDGEGDGKAAGESGAAALSTWVSDDLGVSLSNASVWKRLEKGDREILKKLQGSVRAESAGEYRLRIGGSTREGGTLKCDVRLWPDELRADGRVVLESIPLALLAPLLPAVPWYEPEESRVDAELVVGAETVDRLALRGSVWLGNAALFSDRVAPIPIRGIEARIEGRGFWYPMRRRLEIEEAVLSSGSARLLLDGALERTSEHYLVDLDVELPPTACAEAVGIIPRDLLAEVKGFDWGGSLGIDLSVEIDSRDLDGTRLGIGVDDRCEFRTVPALADLRPFRMPFVHSVVEPDGSVLEMEMGPGTEQWTYLEEVSPFLVHAVLAHEDSAFFGHRGFSPVHIRNALVRNLREGRYVVGASTITMQLVKNLFLRREKTLARKVQEVLLTWWVERVMEKRDILELYLNVIEYGPGIYGIRYAAEHYFQRTPAALSPAESVYLSMILPNPKRYHGQYERGSISPGFADRMRRVLRRLGEDRRFGPEAVEYGLGEIGGFRFYRDGEVAPERNLPGGAARLPYMQAFDDEWDWAASAVPELEVEDDTGFGDPEADGEGEPDVEDPGPTEL